MKKCTMCGEEKDLSNFYNKNKKTELLDCYCKSCCAERNREYYKKTKDVQSPKRKEWQKKYRKSDKYISYQENYTKVNPITRKRYLARKLVWSHVHLGKLIKQPCQVCGETKVEAHHENYDEPVNVIWLCEKHHDDIHKDRYITKFN